MLKLFSSSSLGKVYRKCIHLNIQVAICLLSGGRQNLEVSNSSSWKKINTVLAFVITEIVWKQADSFVLDGYLWLHTRGRALLEEFRGSWNVSGGIITFLWPMKCVWTPFMARMYSAHLFFENKKRELHTSSSFFDRSSALMTSFSFTQKRREPLSPFAAGPYQCKHSPDKCWHINLC